MADTLTHRFNPFGGLADECQNCGIEFSFAMPHQDWAGIPCRAERYTSAEKQAVCEHYCTCFEEGVK